MRQNISKDTIQEHVVFEDNKLLPVLYGEQNAHLQKIEEVLNIQLSTRGNEVTISGDSVHVLQARQVLEALWSRIQQGQDIEPQTVDSALRFLKDHTRKNNGNGNGNGLEDFTETDILITTKKKKINPRSPMQTAYIQAMKDNDLVFGLGPAGTGKTYLAVATAVSMLEEGKVERIILSRPAVEAGENLGFLPGELKEKMDPYMRPLYDSLHDTLSADKIQKKIETEEIEIAPLAFMRGRTLNNAFIILDEAQNTTPMQMLMFLTRIGHNSHMVVTGDPTQIDLPGNQESGLLEASKILKDEDNISFVYFSHKDVVRSKLVATVVQAYDKYRKKT